MGRVGLALLHYLMEMSLASMAPSAPGDAWTVGGKAVFNPAGDFLDRLGIYKPTDGQVQAVNQNLDGP